METTKNDPESSTDEEDEAIIKRFKKVIENNKKNEKAIKARRQDAYFEVLNSPLSPVLFIKQTQKKHALIKELKNPFNYDLLKAKSRKYKPIKRSYNINFNFY